MIRILLAEEYDLVREGVKRVIESCADMHVSAECRLAVEIQRCVQREPHDVLLVGQRMVSALIRLKEAPRVLVLGDPCEVAARGAMAWGVAGYVSQDCSADELVRAVRVVHYGDSYVSGRVVRRGRGVGVEDPLSWREKQVLLRLVAGDRLSEIARALKLSASTVKTYRQRIWEKLDVQDETELARYAAWYGVDV